MIIGKVIYIIRYRNYFHIGRYPYFNVNTRQKIPTADSFLQDCTLTFLSKIFSIYLPQTLLEQFYSNTNGGKVNIRK